MSQPTYQAITGEYAVLRNAYAVALTKLAIQQRECDAARELALSPDSDAERVLHFARKDLDANQIGRLTDLPETTVTALLNQIAAAGIDLCDRDPLTPKPAPNQTCGTCKHFDDEGDCVVLGGIYLPMWLGRLTSIAPVDADISADECDAWSPRD